MPEQRQHAPLVLVIDDEVQIQRLLERTLTGAGYRVAVAGSGGEGLRMAETGRPDAVILDLGLPDMDGTEVLAKLRGWAQFPVMVLSVRSDEREIVACLDSGADDYLVKPFRSGELLARVRAALRHRAGPKADAPFTAGDLVVDPESRTVRRGGEAVKLTAIEFRLLSLFVRNAGRVLTHRYILEQVWGPAFAGETEYTRVHVGNLRKKIEPDPSRPALIVTESGIGYRLVVPA